MKKKNKNDYILLDNIISKNTSISNPNVKKSQLENILESKNEKLETDTNKLDKKNASIRKSNSSKVTISKKKPKDPVADLVDREIKPIIKKWISKNLKSFVKTIVIEEMKLISKATHKHK